MIFVKTELSDGFFYLNRTLVVNYVILSEDQRDVVAANISQFVEKLIQISVSLCLPPGHSVESGQTQPRRYRGAKPGGRHCSLQRHVGGHSQPAPGEDLSSS